MCFHGTVCSNNILLMNRTLVHSAEHVWFLNIIIYLRFMYCFRHPEYFNLLSNLDDEG